MLRALRAREVSAVELLDLHLKRIERFNPALNAIVTPNYDQARQDARGDAFDPAAVRGLEASASDYLGWHGQREQYRAAYRAFFREWGVLLAPTTIVPAFPHTQGPINDR